VLPAAEAPGAPVPAPVPVPVPVPAALLPLDAAMAAHIEQALAATHGRIEGPFGAARLLRVNPHTLRARMRKLGIDWARHRAALAGNSDS
jgi:hypothetical protein